MIEKKLRSAEIPASPQTQTETSPHALDDANGAACPNNDFSLSGAANIIGPYKWPYCLEATVDLIWGFYQCNVARNDYRGIRFYGNIKEVVTQTASYLTSDVIKVEDEGFKPWLCFSGGVGNGKTTMLCTLAQLLRGLRERGRLKGSDIDTPFVIYKSASEILQIRIEAEEKDREPWLELCNADCLLIDDFGKEDLECKYFGKPIYPIAELLNHRYDKRQLTIFATHLLPVEIFGDDQPRPAHKEPRYGEDIARRCKRMTYVIDTRGIPIID